MSTAGSADESPRGSAEETGSGPARATSGDERKTTVNSGTPSSGTPSSPATTGAAQTTPRGHVTDAGAAQSLSPLRKMKPLSSAVRTPIYV